jgi:hypothetical protein
MGVDGKCVLAAYILYMLNITLGDNPKQYLQLPKSLSKIAPHIRADINHRFNNRYTFKLPYS